MEIVIPMKQVPETSNVLMDEETGTMIRKGVESIINPLDLYAIEEGISLKERLGGEITVITMGPPSAKRALQEALSMGCDKALLLTGREFAGSDTWATSYALAEALKKLTEYDLILAGERATDGDTGQVGPGIASFLDIPLATYTSKIVEVDRERGEIIVERLTESGYEVLSLQLPALLTVVKEINAPRLPTLRGKQRAKKTAIPSICGEDLELESEDLGLKGSPTRVVKIERPQVTRGGTLVLAREEDQVEEAVERLLSFLRERGLLREGDENGV